MPWPKLPAEAHTTGRSGPIRPSSARAPTTNQVPRPLNDRIGLSVSTLRITGTPSLAESPSWTYCGPARKTGSMASSAAAIASGASSGIVSIRRASERDSPERRRVPGLAVATAPGDREVGHVDGEAVRPAQGGGEGRDLGRRDLPGAAAVGAMEMGVLGDGQHVVLLPTVRGVAVG